MERSTDLTPSEPVLVMVMLHWEKSWLLVVHAVGHRHGQPQSCGQMAAEKMGRAGRRDWMGPSSLLPT